MSQPSSPRSARLEQRVTPEVQERLRRAARLQGQTVSDFVVRAALDAADRVAERQIIYVSLEAYEQIQDLLDNPPEPTEAMKRAAADYDRLIVYSEP
jgi:uncharacterized protein (DUF1778 family)